MVPNHEFSPLMVDDHRCHFYTGVFPRILSLQLYSYGPSKLVFTKLSALESACKNVLLENKIKHVIRTLVLSQCGQCIKSKTNNLQEFFDLFLVVEASLNGDESQARPTVENREGRLISNNCRCVSASKIKVKTGLQLSTNGTRNDNNKTVERISRGQRNQQFVLHL